MCSLHVLEDWKAHLALLQDKVPHWIFSKILDGVEHIRVDKKVDFEGTVIKKLKNHFNLED